MHSAIHSQDFTAAFTNRPLVKSRFQGLDRLVPAHFSRHDRESASAESAQRGRVWTKGLVHCIGITGRIASFASSLVSFDAPAVVVDHKKAILPCTAQH